MEIRKEQKIIKLIPTENLDNEKKFYNDSISVTYGCFHRYICIYKRIKFISTKSSDKEKNKLRIIK